MDLFATLFGTGWASGVNAYGTVALLGILGRSGAADVPDPVTSTPVIAVALILYAVEFVADKIPYVDNAWDAVHTAVRPAIGSWLGALIAGESGDVSEALGAGEAGGTALLSHAVKAGLRVVINTSPEPLSNIGVSLTEDGLVAAVVFFVVEQPLIALGIAGTLLVLGIAALVYLIRRLRSGLRRLARQRPYP
jgi:Domain of unknown function (DUF4126)